MQTKTIGMTALAFAVLIFVLMSPRRPTGQESTKQYPNDISAARLLWQRPEPSLQNLAKVGTKLAGNEQASLGTQGSVK